jgi:hypothetical protein
VDNPETVATFATKDTGRRQSRDTGNIRHTRHRTKTIQRQWQHLSQKTQDKDNSETVATLVTQDKDNPETLVTFVTKDTGRRQFRDSGNICHKRHRTKTIQRQWQHLPQKTLATFVTKDNPETVATFVTKDTGQRQFRDSGNICHKRHRTKTIQRQWQHLPQKTQDEDNPETVATLGTQDTGRRQSRDSGNICHKRHRTKTIQRQWQHLPQRHRTKTIQRQWQHLPQKTQDEDNSETVATFATKDIGQRQFRDSGNICHKRHRTKTIQRQWQHLSQKTQDEDNPETVATFVTKDTGQRQFRDTGNICHKGHRQFRDSGNICHKRHRTKTKKTNKITQNRKLKR